VPGGRFTRHNAAFAAAIFAPTLERSRAALAADVWAPHLDTALLLRLLRQRAVTLEEARQLDGRALQERLAGPPTARGGAARDARVGGR
jgi:hypothetical protein